MTITRTYQSMTVSLGDEFDLFDLSITAYPEHWTVKWKPEDPAAFSIVSESKGPLNSNLPGASRPYYITLKAERIGHWTVIAELVSNMDSGTVYERIFFPVEVPMLCLPGEKVRSISKKDKDSGSDSDDGCCLVC